MQAHPIECKPGLGTGAALLRGLYNGLWYPVLPLALLAGGGWHAGSRRQRLGFIPHRAGARAALRIWLHASSVGEIEAARPVMLGLLEAYPTAALTITTMTSAGAQAAAERIQGAVYYGLAPLDHPCSVRRFLSAWRPRLVLIAERELWPNFFLQSRRAGAKVVLLNGRLSRRSLARYQRLWPLWAATLAQAERLLVQTPEDAINYIALGAKPDRIVITGNTKFTEAASMPPHPALTAFMDSRPTLIAGSTSPGEEAVVVDAYARLTTRFALKLVLAPRHLERMGEIEALLTTRGLPYVKASALKQDANQPLSAILLLDTMGDLRLLYRYGTVAFVGGSLFPGRGGQNLGEPASVGVPVLFGPHHENQLAIARALLDAGGGAVVSDGADLTAIAGDWLAAPARARQAGEQARAAYETLAGGASRALVEVSRLIDTL